MRIVIKVLVRLTKLDVFIHSAGLFFSDPLATDIRELPSQIIFMCSYGVGSSL